MMYMKMEKKRFYEMAIANYEERKHGPLQIFVAVKNIKIGDEIVTADVILSEDADVSTIYRNCEYSREMLDEYEPAVVL